MVDIGSLLDNASGQSTNQMAEMLARDKQALINEEPVSSCAMSAPRRRSRVTSAQANEIASILFPGAISSLDAIIQYEKLILKLRATYKAQNLAKADHTAQQRYLTAWPGRIETQGPWDEINDPVSLAGAPSLPMPVAISNASSLEPFFQYLANDGDFDDTGDLMLQKEPNYDTQYVEFEKGILYEDGRMDLCKQVLGPHHISDLIDALENNHFVKHFLLGNNIIGPRGARAIAAYIQRHPDRMQTWYLAGCCIDSTSFSVLAESLALSINCQYLWLKRNPLLLASAEALSRLIIQMPNLTTLDLDQTELGDEGVSKMFKILASCNGTPPSLQTIYLNATGIGHIASVAIGDFLGSGNCALTSLYMACNPIGGGVHFLCQGLAANTSLRRLSLASVGMKTSGAKALFTSLRAHTHLMALDVSHSYATEDLRQRYNYIGDDACPALIDMITQVRTLRSLRLGITAMSQEVFEGLEGPLVNSDLLFLVASSFRFKAKDSSAMSNALREMIRRNLAKAYGPNMTAEIFLTGPARFIHSPEDVRFIDSQYRNRDVFMVRRGEKVLDKLWSEEDSTLEDVARS